MERGGYCLHRVWSEDFSTVSPKSFIVTLLMYELDEQTVRWTKNVGMAGLEGGDSWHRPVT